MSTTILSNEELSVLTKKTVGGLAVEPVAEQTKFINILVYGFSGVGKTVLAGSASIVPEMAPVLLLDLEGGTLSLKRTYPDVEVVRIKTWMQLQSVYDEIILGRTGYKTVVLDSISEFQRLSMGTLMYGVVKKKSDDGIVTKEAEWGLDLGDQNIFVPSQREWGINLGQMRQMIRAFRDAPINAIFTALAKQAVDKKTGMWRTTPSLQGQVGNEVPGFLDEVLYYYVKMVEGQPQRILLTSKTETEEAKDRSGTLEQTIVSPTMEILYKTMTGA